MTFGLLFEVLGSCWLLAGCKGCLGWPGWLARGPGNVTFFLEKLGVGRGIPLRAFPSKSPGKARRGTWDSTSSFSKQKSTFHLLAGFLAWLPGWLARGIQLLPAKKLEVESHAELFLEMLPFSWKSSAWDSTSSF